MILKPGTYWITRDTEVDGDLCDRCDVWNERPQRISGGDGWIWLSAEWSLDTRVGTAPVEAIRAEFGTAPDTDRECLRVLR